jgi:hypothetical protein
MKSAMSNIITIQLNESIHVRNVKEPVDLQQADEKNSFTNSKSFNCKN